MKFRENLKKATNEHISEEQKKLFIKALDELGKELGSIIRYLANRISLKNYDGVESYMADIMSKQFTICTEVFGMNR